jgi:hypothetical protein
VQAGEATGTPKAQDGAVEMLRALRAARQTAVKARTQAVNALKGLLVTAPAELHEQLAGLPTTQLVGAAATPAPATPRTLSSSRRLSCGPDPKWGSCMPEPAWRACSFDHV